MYNVILSYTDMTKNIKRLLIFVLSLLAIQRFFKLVVSAFILIVILGALVVLTTDYTAAEVTTRITEWISSFFNYIWEFAKKYI